MFYLLLGTLSSRDLNFCSSITRTLHYITLYVGTIKHCIDQCELICSGPLGVRLLDMLVCKIFCLITSSALTVNL